VEHEQRTVVVFSGGGTGGHLYPALALAEALVSRRPDVRPFFVGAERGVEARVLPAQGHEHLLVPARGVARGGGLPDWSLVRDLLRALGQVSALFRQLRPSLVVVTGGYAGAPAGAMAVLHGIPLALQEQNSVPGVTTRLLARFARQIHAAFPETLARLPRAARARTRLSGNPVRPPVPLGSHAARAVFGLDADGPVVLVVGGSQGSLALNRAVLDAVSGVVEGKLPRPEGLQLLWSTGHAHLPATALALAEMGEPAWVRAVGYIERMDAALAGADVALSRAGAMATSEFLAWGLPAILVPLPTAAADHQTENARSLEKAGAAVHLPEASLTGEALWREVTALVGDAARLAASREAALAIAHPDASQRIAEDLDQLLPPTRPRGAA
jgi:UDP-N-acetylglucosamine--N-acetylmuramyl-(pentapeptide) pyrophosphoryl-undecaprenol N-acetylglucosamine transferase